MARSHSESVAINVGAGFALNLVNQLLGFVVTTIFIQMLGVQYNGVSTLFTDILSVLSLAEMGIGSAITFALYKPIREGDNRRIAALMNFYKRAYRLIAAVVFAGGMLCIPFLHLLVTNVPDITEDIRLIFALYIINSASSYLLAYKHTMLTASERRYVISRVSMAMSFARTAVECAVLFWTKSFIPYLLVGFGFSLIRNFIISKQADKYFPALEGYVDEKLTREETKKLLADVGALSLYKICQTVLNSTDSIVISAAPALGVVLVGYLGNYRRIFNIITSVINQFYTSFVPSLGAMAAHTTAAHQHRVFRETNFVTFWMVCFCSTSLFCLSVPFVRTIWLRGAEYSLPMNIIAVLTLNFYTSIMMRPTNAFRTSNGLFVEGKYRPVVMAVLNIVLDIALVVPLGVVGVLLATSIARLATQTWYDPWLLYRRVFKRSPKEYFLRYGAYTLITVASCALTYYLCQLARVIDPFALRFVVMMLLCVVVPNGLVLIIYGRSEECRDMLGRMRMLLNKLTARIRRRKGKAD